MRRETTLRVDHEVVQAAPWNFVLDSATADEEPPEHPTLAEPEPLFAEPTKLRAVSRCLVGGGTFEPGTSFEAPGPSACWLISEGHAKNA